MKEFSEIKRIDCDKCGGGPKKVEYVDTEDFYLPGLGMRQFDLIPYILWTCLTCGFTEKSYPKDHKSS